DLAQELPLRAHLLRLGADDQVLLLLVHHSAADGGSVAPLLEDLGAAYRARLSGRAPELEPLAVQYADYTLWQRQLLGEESDPDSLLARQLQHWRTQLRELPVEISLPTDRARPLRASCPAGSLQLHIPAALLAALTARTREAGATLFMGLQAALAALLSRLGAGSDIPVGTVVAARPQACLDRLVGFFVNTLVLRHDLSGDPTFATLLARTLTLCLQAYTQQELPFERLVESLDPPRALGRQPLFQSMLVLNPEEPAHFHAPGLTPEPLALPAAVAKFDLCFTFTPRAQQLEGLLEYNAALFDPDTAAALAARFTHLLAQLCAQPQRPLSRLDILLPHERARLASRPEPTLQSAQPTTLVALFEAQAARSPQATALLYQSEHCSYATLERRANQLAWHLIDCGIAPEDIVALSFERSFQMLIALLATLKAGAAYLPLDPQLPVERLRFMLEDARPRLLLSTRALAPRLPQEALCLEDLEPLLAAQPPTAPDNCWRNAPLLPAHPAYLIYTSGSSGTPKAVVIQHQSVAHYVEVVGRDVLGTASASMPLFTAVGFDLTLTTLFTPLCFGGTVHIVSDTGTEAALRTVFAADAGLTAVKLTPSHISMLASLAPTRSPIRVAIVGGEALTDSQARVLRERCPDIRIVNEYGPTETTIGSTAAIVDEAVTIGAPYPNTCVYVLDDTLQPCPTGAPGELYIGGPGLARGYHARPGLTAARFIASPFAAGERLYRTGDRALRRRDGKLIFLGRADEQLKIRGFRIEPGEIETQLCRLPRIAQAAVRALPGPTGELRLAAYLVPREPALAGTLVLDHEV
ncbi:MAG TPA: amino acid adenylation domain-containing protein, partial [Steroidobacteraceae bacterium]|nr:amino acid adenylation domain-containing protein [Steroidobacteraceae bacterium]